MSDESASRDAGGEIPEAKLVVPASGKRELAIRGEDDVFDEVGVAGEASVSDAVGFFICRERIGRHENDFETVNSTFPYPIR